MSAATNVDYQARIPNNVNLGSDRRLQRALERWLPNYLEWWHEMGPEGFQADQIYLRTAISVEKTGWAHFDYIKMPDYRWGIFLNPMEAERKIGFGDHMGKDAWDEVPGEYRNALRRIIVTQADTEPASVEQQRLLGQTCPSLYDLRNLFQVNVEEGRHLWAMVYLLHSYFGRDGREEAEELLQRRSGNPDKPRILNVFNEPIDDWLSFFCFAMFTDRDGKFQLGALAESAFTPLAASTRFMLTEEAHHLFVGQTGLDRVIRRSCELMNGDLDADITKLGAIPLTLIQRYINRWFSLSLDLFGSEVSSNGATFFANSLKGRYQEQRRWTDHVGLEEAKQIAVVRGGQVRSEEVPLRNAMNEVLRDEYIADCDKAVGMWNRTAQEAGIGFQFTLPDRKFHRHQGEYAASFFTPEGNLIDEETFHASSDAWLGSDADQAYVQSLMQQVTEPGKFANWIAPPKRGINGNGIEFAYVKFSGHQRD
jgi:benzoyl-CoA 2,3-dioxygenase component B